MLTAEAGLSECARDPVCDADLSRPIYTFLLIVFLICLSVVGSMFSTFYIGKERIGFKRSAPWVGVVWLLPLIGTGIWCIRQMHHYWGWRGRSSRASVR